MRLAYDKIGEGPSLFLLHGLFGSRQNLRQVAQFLSSRFTVFSIDLRNHGESGHDDSMTYKQMAQDLFEFVKMFNLGAVHVVGHSMGGKVGMTFSLLYPQLVQSLVVVDIAPVAYPLHHQRVCEGLLAINVNAIQSRSDADSVLAEYVPESFIRLFLLKNLKHNNGVYQWRCGLRAISANQDQIAYFDDALGEFNGEVLFVKGTESSYLDASYESVVIRLFPKAVIESIDGAGHWVHATHMVALSGILSRFFRNF